MNKYLLLSFLFLSTAFSSINLLAQDILLVPKNILDIQTGKLITGNIHIKNGLIY